jgi:hypothetical protein
MPQATVVNSANQNQSRLTGTFEIFRTISKCFEMLENNATADRPCQFVFKKLGFQRVTQLVLATQPEALAVSPAGWWGNDCGRVV